MTLAELRWSYEEAPQPRRPWEAPPHRPESGERPEADKRGVGDSELEAAFFRLDARDCPSILNLPLS